MIYGSHCSTVMLTHTTSGPDAGCTVWLYIPSKTHGGRGPKAVQQGRIETIY